MPTMPELPERPTWPERASSGVRRASHAIGVEGAISLRVLLALAAAVIAMSEAPRPHRQVGLAALLMIALDFARTRRVSAVVRQ